MGTTQTLLCRVLNIRFFCYTGTNSDEYQELSVRFTWKVVGWRPTWPRWARWWSSSSHRRRGPSCLAYEWRHHLRDRRWCSGCSPCGRTKARQWSSWRLKENNFNISEINRINLHLCMRERIRYKKQLKPTQMGLRVKLNLEQEDYESLIIVPFETILSWVSWKGREPLICIVQLPGVQSHRKIHLDSSTNRSCKKRWCKSFL